MPFDVDLTLRPASAFTWRLVGELRYQGEDDEYLIPDGYVTDLATVPRFLIWLVRPYGPYTRAAVWHDFALTNLIPAKRITSRDADGIFRRIMREEGTPPVIRWVMWAAVRSAALFNSKRAYGRAFWRDAPAVLGIAVLALPFVLPGALGALISLGLVWPLRFIGRRKP